MISTDTTVQLPQWSEKYSRSWDNTSPLVLTVNCHGCIYFARPNSSSVLTLALSPFPLPLRQSDDRQRPRTMSLNFIQDELYAEFFTSALAELISRYPRQYSISQLVSDAEVLVWDRDCEFGIVSSYWPFALICDRPHTWLAIYWHSISWSTNTRSRGSSS